MFGIGFQEMLIILVVVLIFFGPKRLPDLAKSLGKGIAEFKKASEEVRKGIEEVVKEESAAPHSPAPPETTTPPSPAAGAAFPEGEAASSSKRARAGEPVARERPAGDRSGARRRPRAPAGRRRAGPRRRAEGGAGWRGRGHRGGRGRCPRAGARHRRRAPAARAPPHRDHRPGCRAVIIRMSKVEIAGPREQLLPVLETIERSGVLQIDASLRERAGEDAERGIRPLALDGRTLAERLFLEDLKIKVERLLALLPEVEARESYLSP